MSEVSVASSFMRQQRLHPQVAAPYRAQTYALRRRLVDSSALDRARLIGSYIQVGG